MSSDFMNRRAFCVLGATSMTALLAGCVNDGSFQTAALGYRPVPQLGTPDREPYKLPYVDIHKVPTNLRRQYVSHSGKYKPGTIVVDTAGRHLYLIEDQTTAIRYGIGVGREGFSWGGRAKIGRKAQWPTWTPPASMIRREPELRKWASGMPGGPQTPLGARALELLSGDGIEVARAFLGSGLVQAFLIDPAQRVAAVRALHAGLLEVALA